MPSTTDSVVCNLALSHIGVGKRIAALDENSKEANACNLFYDLARDELLRGFVWPFGKREAALGLVTEYGDDAHPTTLYRYAYRYPSDCLMARRIQSGLRNDNRQSRVPYDLMLDEQGTLIVTDQEDAVLEYTSTLAQNPSRWSADFIFTLAFRMAAYIAPLVTGGDPFKIGQTAIRFYDVSSRKAQANAANEVQDEDMPDSETIRARD